MATGLINECVPFTKEVHASVRGSFPPLVRSQHEFSMLMAKGRPMAETRESLLAPLPPPSSQQEFQARFPRGCVGRASVARSRSQSPCAFWTAKGRGDPTPPFCFRACPPSTSRTYGSAHPEWALSGPHAERTSRSLCAGARARPPPSVQHCPPPPPNTHTAHTQSRARQVGPPASGPRGTPRPARDEPLRRGARRRVARP